MPTLNATAGSADANAYTELDAVQALASDRGPAGVGFLSLSEDEQISAIITEAARIDTLDYAGWPADIDVQSMEWPRVGTKYDLIPPRVVKANRESAIAEWSRYADGATPAVFAPTANGNIKERTIGPIKKVFFAPTDTAANPLAKFSVDVQALLWPLLRVNIVAEQGNRWGSAVVVMSG